MPSKVPELTVTTGAEKAAEKELDFLAAAFSFF
jgi:hypothetical protein